MYTSYRPPRRQRKKEIIGDRDQAGDLRRDHDGTGDLVGVLVTSPASTRPTTG